MRQGLAAGWAAGQAVGQGAGADDLLTRFLAILAAQSMAVWFDPDWTPGVTIANDAGTLRMTAMQSRPISGQTQYTVSQGSLPLAPATSTSPNGRRVLTYAGTQYLQGAGALATLLQGSASYSEVHVASRSATASIGRWSAGLVAATDNRIVHYVSATGATVRFRAAAGASTTNNGSNVTITDPHVFSSTYAAADYDGWLDRGAETLTGGGANARAPATLDTLAIGAIWTTGAAANLWQGVQAGLIITSPLSTADRQSLESLGAYYGYAI